MYINKLELNNFRNYSQEEVYLANGLNIISGKNAQGKTNLVEAIYLLSTGGSPRTANDKELIKIGAERARIFGNVMWESGDRQIEMILSRKEKKRATVNGMNIAKIGELLGNMNTVYFSPDEMGLIKDSPDYRRRFMDIDLCQLSRSYFYTLHKYNKILKQRNALLKGDKKNSAKELIGIYDQQLAGEGAKLIKQRKSFCQNISLYASEIHGSLSGMVEELVISYQTSAEGDSESDIASSLIQQLERNFERDLRLGYTSVGAQRDDIKIMLSGIDVRTYGSQGQQRTATLSMKLAEIEVFNNINREKPILLLDDVLSELDENRRSQLIKRAENLQTIITCTNAEVIKNKGLSIVVDNGKIVNKK